MSIYSVLANGRSIMGQLAQARLIPSASASLLLKTTASTGFDPSIIYGGGDTPHWVLGDGNTYNGASVTHDYADSSEKEVSLSVSDYSLVTTIDARADSITELGDLSAYTGLLYLYAFSNGTLATDVSAATWPSSITYLYLYDTGVSGDVSAATWPSSLLRLYLYNTSVSGDVSAATWPSSIEYLLMQNTSVSGDVSAATWPSSMQQLRLENTGVSGDVSAATWPSSIRQLYLDINSSISYGTSNSFQSLTYNTVVIRMNSCTLSQAECDAILSDLVAGSITSGTLDISSNSTPSAAGLADKATLIARGWTVTTD